MFSHLVYSTLSSRLSCYNMVIYFLVLPLRISWESHELSWVKKVLNCPQRRKLTIIIARSESVKNKVELSRMLNIPRTTIMSILSKYRRTATVETLMQSGSKRSFTNRDRNALKHLVKSNRRLTVQEITAKISYTSEKQRLSARKPCKGCCIRKDIKEG